MFFYLFITTISLCLFFIANRFYSLKNKSLFYLVILCFLLFPSIFAGARDFTVGIDIDTYGLEHFQYAARCNSLYELYQDPPSHELGWFAFNYLSSRLINDLNFFFFLSELLKLVLVSYTAIHLRQRLNPVIFMFTYFMFFYFAGWCLMRQSLALAFCCLAFTYYLDKKYVWFVLIILIARTFHNSAVLMLVFPIFDYMKKWKYSYILTLSGLIMAFSSIYFIIEKVAESGLFREDFYDLYFDSGVPTSKAFIVIDGLYILYGILFTIEKRSNMRCLIANNAIFTMALVLMGQYVNVAYRAAFYPMLCLMIISLISIKSVKSQMRRISYLVVCSSFFLYFYVESNHELLGTIPYSSFILGISK